MVKASAYKGAAIVSILRLPKLVVSLPEKGMVSNCPTGKANNTLPNWASESSKADFKSGILLAHEAKTTP